MRCFDSGTEQLSLEISDKIQLFPGRRSSYFEAIVF